MTELSYVFGMIEEGLNLRMGGRRYAVEKLHHGIHRAIQYYGFTPGELLDEAPAISMALSTDSSNTICHSAFHYLKGVRESQGRYSPLERNTRPVEGSLEWDIDRQMLYELWAPLMVSRENLQKAWKSKSFLVTLTKWMQLYETQVLIDLCSALQDAGERGVINATGYLSRLARSPEYGYKWQMLLPDVISWCQAEGVWEGEPEPLINVKKKRATEKRKINNSP